jgi:hypothetical protein
MFAAGGFSMNQCRTRFITPGPHAHDAASFASRAISSLTTSIATSPAVLATVLAWAASFASPEQYWWLYDRRAPLPNSQIWLCRYTGI